MTDLTNRPMTGLEWMLRTTTCLAVLTGLCIHAWADWPQANGPAGNFTPKRHGHAIVDDLHDVTPVWASEYHDLGFAKGSASGYIANLAKWECRAARACVTAGPP